MKKYWDTYYPGGPYDALGRRSNMAGPAKSVTGGGSTSGLRSGMSKRTTGAGMRSFFPLNYSGGWSSTIVPYVIRRCIGCKQSGKYYHRISHMWTIRNTSR